MCSEFSRPARRPGLAAVLRLVEAVAEAHAALVVVLAGAQPDDVRVFRIDDDDAERIGTVGVEYGRPGVAAVLGLPQIPRGRGHVPDAGILRIDLDVRQSARRQARAQTPEREIPERLRVRPCSGPLGHTRGREQDRRAEPRSNPSHASSFLNLPWGPTPTACQRSLRSRRWLAATVRFHNIGRDRSCPIAIAHVPCPIPIRPPPAKPAARAAG